jgi:hypothetical protein
MRKSSMRVARLLPILPFVVVSSLVACPFVQTYSPGPGPEPRVEVECDDTFIAAQQSPFDDVALGDCYTVPYEGWPNGCATCHASGTPDGVGTGWGPADDVTSAGWYSAVVGNALTSDLSDLPGTDLMRTLIGGTDGWHPAQPECADAMLAWLGGFSAGCGGAPVPTPDAGIVDAGVSDGGREDGGQGDGGPLPVLDAGPVVLPDAGVCPDGGPWPDATSEAFFVERGLATKLQTCHGCHNTGPDLRNGDWGPTTNDATEWHSASRILLSKQDVALASSTTLVIKLSTQHLTSAPDPIAAANMEDWINFVWLCEP